MVNLQVQSRGAPSQCSYCRTTAESKVWTCPGCRTTLHEACFQELGTCPTVGCQHRAPQAPQHVAQTPPRVVVESGTPCWLCRTSATTDVWICRDCGTTLHQSCFRDLDHCPGPLCQPGPLSWQQRLAGFGGGLALHAIVLVMSLVIVTGVPAGSDPAHSYASYSNSFGPSIADLYYGFVGLLLILLPQAALWFARR